MKITFSNSDWAAVHGGQPRGTGTWAFDIVWENGRGGFDSYTFVARPYLTLTEARKEAVAHAKAASFGAVRATISTAP